ncbi:MAG: glucokinase, partial [Betaproteobacteria bacterium]|nr:glucokinase [Betaproteobacteria bacterium]
MSFLLAADIGGTHSRFALFAMRDAPASPADLELVREHWLPTAQYKAFADLAHELRLPDGSPFAPPGTLLASLGIAGPVRDGSCKPPNISWDISTVEASAALDIPTVLLVNDFVAQGYACLLSTLHAQTRAALEIVELYAGKKSLAPVALIGAGSGCGKALVLPEARTVLPSEGGHGEYPFRRDEESFADILRNSLGERIVAEMLVSGNGLRRLFAYHCG